MHQREPLCNETGSKSSGKALLNFTILAAVGRRLRLCINIQKQSTSNSGLRTTNNRSSAALDATSEVRCILWTNCMWKVIKIQCKRVYAQSAARTTPRVISVYERWMMNCDGRRSDFVRSNAIVGKLGRAECNALISANEGKDSSSFSSFTVGETG